METIKLTDEQRRELFQILDLMEDNGAPLITKPEVYLEQMAALQDSINELQGWINRNSPQSAAPHPVRIQRSRQHKQESPNGLPIVYVGRPGKWGNPFTLEYSNPENCYYTMKGKYTLKYSKTKPEALADILKRFKEYILKVDSADLQELRGKNLSCWCPLDSPCHADILLQLANA